MLQFNKKLQINTQTPVDGFAFIKTPFNINGNGSGEPTWQDIVLSGNGSLTLTHAKANGLNYVKLFGACQLGSVPNGYKRVTSLTTDGVAYLETPYNVYAVDRVQGTVSFTRLTTGNGLQYVVGGRSGTSSSSAAVGYCVYAPSHGGLTYYPLAWKTNSVGISATIGVDYVFDTTIVSQSTIKLIINDSVRQDTTMSGSKGSGAGTNKICLFSLTSGAYNQKGTILKDKVVFYGTDGEILAYYIFVERESDNALGILNLLDGSFITNDEGTFTRGDYVYDTPTPTNPVNILCNNGKLKLSPNIFKGTFDQFDNTGGSGSTYAYFKLPEENETYTLTVRCKKAFQGTSNTFLGFTNTGGTQSGVKWVISSGTNADVGKVISIDNGGIRNFVSMYSKTEATLNKILDCFDIQLEKGSTATDYVPYGEVCADGTIETVTDSLNNTATAENLISLNDTYTDTQELLSGAVIRKVGVKVLDGTESWTAAVGGVYSKFNDVPATTDRLDAYCTHFVHNKNADTINGLTSGEFTFSRSGGTTTRNCSFKDSTVTTSVTTWKAFLAEQYAAGTPVIVVYPLENEVTETAAGQTLTTKAGTNHLTITQASLNGLGIEASYKRRS